MIGPRRVVVTGLGVLAANGIGKEAFWDSLLAGRSGIGPVTLCDVAGLESRIAGEVHGFDPRAFIHGRHHPRHITRTAQLAIAASILAVRDARLDADCVDRDVPVAVYMGVSMGGFDFIEREVRRIAARGLPSMHPSVVGCVNVMPGSLVVEHLGLPARLATMSNSCVGGIDAIAAACAEVQRGGSDVALAGATDAPVVSCLMAGFSAAKMLSTANEAPEKASRPFDALRDRGVLAEGSAVVVVESLDHALRRGATCYAEFVSAFSSMDGEEGGASGLESTMAGAMNAAGLLPSDVDYVCAHGPSDREIDRVETEMIRRVLGRHADRIPVNSIKGCTGNPLSAGGPMQVVAASLALRKGWIFPTANYEFPDPRCDLDYVPGTARRLACTHAMINAHGMGGVNTSFILRSAP
jgi:3-oxoacyl-[acyl-carrier-protein] synthase II